MPIRHIPHDSTEIPERYLGQYLLSAEGLDRELLRMTDAHTAGLFGGGDADLVFPVSRLLVDVERFEDDAQEVMASRGMGVLYDRTHDLALLRRELGGEEREELLSRYYRPHHAELTRLVDAELEARGRALVIDCHSFPSRRLPYEISTSEERPEICIGTDAFHTPTGLRDTALEGFREAGLGVTLDDPFAGAITPLKHYGREGRVWALMIEVRRDLYMDEGSGEKLPEFDGLREIVQKVIGDLGR